MKLAITFLNLIVLANFKPYIGINDPEFGVICPESEDGYAVFVPHPTDCHLYYECVGLTPVLMSCPGDLYFDPALSICNWPDQVNCHPKTEAPETTPVVEETTTSKDETTPATIDTTTILVEDTTAVEEETTTAELETTTAEEVATTAEVETTTAELETTTAEEDTTTAEEVTITAAEETTTNNQNDTTNGQRGDFPDFDVVCHESEDGFPVYVPHPTQCNLYYQCVGLTPFLLYCPGELFFDPILNVCNWPDQVDCESQTEAPLQETTTNEEATSTTDEETTGNENAKKVFKRSIDPQFDVVCPPSEDGSTVFVPHPTDCNLYYICVDEMPFLMQCPGDLYFDSVINICNWPDLVDCEPRTTGNQETTTIHNVNNSTTTNEVKTTTIL